MPIFQMPVGWNWKNSMSSSGRPLRATMPMPSPVRVCALLVTLKTLPKPPLANSTDLACTTCRSPVASS